MLTTMHTIFMFSKNDFGTDRMVFILLMIFGTCNRWFLADSLQIFHSHDGSKPLCSKRLQSDWFMAVFTWKIPWWRTANVLTEATITTYRSARIIINDSSDASHHANAKTQETFRRILQHNHIKSHSPLPCQFWYDFLPISTAIPT